MVRDVLSSDIALLYAGIVLGIFVFLQVFDDASAAAVVAAASTNLDNLRSDPLRVVLYAGALLAVWSWAVLLGPPLIGLTRPSFTDMGHTFALVTGLALSTLPGAFARKASLSASASGSRGISAQRALIDSDRGTQK